MFIAIQSAVYSGYVDVDWKKVQHDAVAKVDTVRKSHLFIYVLLKLKYVPHNQSHVLNCFFYYMYSIDQDGDGELTTADLKNYWITVKKVLTNKIPSAGGFSIGFLYGVKHS